MQCNGDVGGSYYLAAGYLSTFGSGCAHLQASLHPLRSAAQVHRCFTFTSLMQAVQCIRPEDPALSRPSRNDSMRVLSGTTTGRTRIASTRKWLPRYSSSLLGAMAFLRSPLHVANSPVRSLPLAKFKLDHPPAFVVLGPIVAASQAAEQGCVVQLIVASAP